MATGSIENETIRSLIDPVNRFFDGIQESSARITSAFIPEIGLNPRGWEALEYGHRAHLYQHMRIGQDFVGVATDLFRIPTNYYEMGLLAAPLAPSALNAFKPLGRSTANTLKKVPVFDIRQSGISSVRGLDASAKTNTIFTGCHEGASPLLPKEGLVGTFRELKELGVTGDNLTAHHMPSSKYMKNKGVSHNDGISMWVEEPNPGTGGRHRQTRTYGRRGVSNNLVNELPRDSLARDIQDMRSIYQNDGVYTPEIRSALKKVIQENRITHAPLFDKKG